MFNHVILTKKVSWGISLSPVRSYGRLKNDEKQKRQNSELTGDFQEKR